jgi:dTMP kinase
MFISLEGPEGSGKSSQLPRLAAHLRQAGRDVLATREPGGTPIGDQVRAVLTNLENTAMHPRAEILLFLASRAQLVEQVIVPALRDGKIVIADRFADSTLAYQGYGHGVDLDTLRQLLAFATGGLTPDLTLLLDIDPAAGLKRRKSSGGEWNRLDAYDLEFHNRVRQGYLHMACAEPRRFVVIDASQPPDVVQADLCRAVDQRLGIYQQG